LAGELGCGLRLVQLGVGFGCVDTGDDFPRRDQVALVRHDLDDAPGDLRRDVDLRRLDPAVDADDAPGQREASYCFQNT
jgi:hypothetical protein